MRLKLVVEVCGWRLWLKLVVVVLPAEGFFLLAVEQLASVLVKRIALWYGRVDSSSSCWMLLVESDQKFVGVAVTSVAVGRWCWDMCRKHVGVTTLAAICTLRGPSRKAHNQMLDRVILTWCAFVHVSLNCILYNKCRNATLLSLDLVFEYCDNFPTSVILINVAGF